MSGDVPASLTDVPESDLEWKFIRSSGPGGQNVNKVASAVQLRFLLATNVTLPAAVKNRLRRIAGQKLNDDGSILILARTDCRPTQGIDEAVARIAMYVEEGADILFLDSPADEAEIRRAIDAAAGRPSFVVLSPGAPRATPGQQQAATLGFKIGTYPTAMLSPAAAGMKAGLAAMAAGGAEASTALPPAELRAILGYDDYDAEAKRFRIAG